MRTHIDWLSFTCPVIYRTGEDQYYIEAVREGMYNLLGEDVYRHFMEGEWIHEARGRAPYTDTWATRDTGMTLYSSPNTTHATIEISGQGCELLIQSGWMRRTLPMVAERVTRIDIACDIETETLPLEFVSEVSHNRMRSNGHHDSETGMTRYVGSKESERFARVYRYFPPHPRAHLLRVEHVFRRDYAKQVARAIVADSVGAVGVAAGTAFGWAHRDWDVTSDSSPDISITAPEKNAGKTISWLVRSVGPSIQRLILDGTIRDPEAFFRTYFLPPEESMLD